MTRIHSQLLELGYLFLHRRDLSTVQNVISVQGIWHFAIDNSLLPTRGYKNVFIIACCAYVCALHMCDCFCFYVSVLLCKE